MTGSGLPRRLGRSPRSIADVVSDPARRAAGDDCLVSFRVTITRSDSAIGCRAHPSNKPHFPRRSTATPRFCTLPNPNRGCSGAILSALHTGTGIRVLHSPPSPGRISKLSSFPIRIPFNRYRFPRFAVSGRIALRTCAVLRISHRFPTVPLRLSKSWSEFHGPSLNGLDSCHRPRLPVRPWSAWSAPLPHALLREHWHHTAGRQH